MIDIQGVLVSDEILESHFLCDLNACKGACCVEGDLGAPLNNDELEILESTVPRVLPFLSEESLAQIKKQGNYIFDEDREYSTPTVEGRACVYAFKNEKGVMQCGFEKAFLEGKTRFRKPISCHLYPIRISTVGNTLALNYHRWEICDPACKLGSSKKVPLYQFLKEALIRKFGNAWYAELEANARSSPQPSESV